jgi:hypothetical protein
MRRLECVGCKIGRARKIPLVKPTISLNERKKERKKEKNLSPFHKKIGLFLYAIVLLFQLSTQNFFSGFLS